MKLSTSTIKILSFASLVSLGLLVSASVTQAGVIIRQPSYIGLNNGLVGYWNFDGPNIVGTSARDTSGGNRHGTISGAVKKPGKLGQALDFDGIGWSQVGNGLAITGTGAPALASLNSTDVAFIDATNELLTTYRFNGIGWSQVGNSLSVFTANPALAALTSTDVAFIDQANDSLRTYRFNGTDWAQVGNGLSVTSTVNPALAALTSTDVAFIDGTNNSLRTYRFNGTAWSQVGNSLAITSTTYPALATLNSTDVALIDFASDSLRTYRFNGTDWAQVGNSLSVSGTGQPALASLNSTDVAFIDGTNESLRTYNWASVVDIGTGPSSVRTVAFWVNPRTTTEYFVNLTGTTDYIWANAGTVTATGLSSPTIYVDGEPTIAITAGAWHHVVVVTDTAENASNLDIGRAADVNYLNGLLDDVRVYNRALSAIEAARLYKIGLASKTNLTASVDLQSRGLVGHWTFDGPDISGTRAKDRSGNENHGTLTGGTSLQPVAGKLGQALTFDGVDDRVTMGNVLDFEKTDSFTISTWVKLPSATPSTADQIVTKVNSSNVGYVFSIRGDQANDPVEIELRGSGVFLNAVFNQTWTTNWTHLVWTYDGSNTVAGMKLYRDGVSQAVTSSLSNLNQNITNTGDFLIGAQIATNNPVLGSVDDVRIYNRALSAAEIQNQYNQSQSKFNSSQTGNSLDKGLVGYWNFDGPNISGTRAKDASGNNNHGTIAGAVVDAGKVGQGLKFDGVDDHISAPGAAVSAAPFSMCAWTKLDALPGASGAVPVSITKNDDTGISHALRIDSGDINAATAVFAATYVTTVETGRWYHLCGVWSANDNRVLYVDGVRR